MKTLYTVDNIITHHVNCQQHNIRVLVVIMANGVIMLS
jgi:hypothetical protein